MTTFERRKDDNLNKKTFYIIYIIAFLNAFHYSLPIYVESSYLKGLFAELVTDPDKYFGLIYSAAFFITFLIFINIAKILRKFTNFKLTFLLVLIEILVLLGLSFLQSPIWSIALFIIHLIVGGIIYFNIDLFLESFSNNGNTGSIRGMYLTIISTAGLIAPFIAGLILNDGDFWKLFLASAFLMIPILLLLYLQFRDYRDPEYSTISFLNGLREIKKRKNIRHIMYTNFLLRLFYAWMIVYTPVYLHQYMGIEFNVIVGIIMPIALLPFILLEFILGKIADTKLGEKELLVTGFIITAISVAIIPFIESSGILIWATVLFATRVGASFIESMTETYFFKKIDAEDAYLIGYFRNVRPIAYIIGPLIASVILFFYDMPYIFIGLSFILLTGIISALKIEDTL